MIEENVYIGTYSDNFFENNPDMANVDGLIYYLKIGDVYKVGITRVNVEGRVARLKCDSKMEVEIIDFMKIRLIDAYKLEQEILNRYEKFRIYTEWSTELFNHDVLNGKLNGGK